jgi:HPt (histidine-containing phosphotransfer) domain-containing protein
MSERDDPPETLDGEHFARLADSLGPAVHEVIAEFNELAVIGALEIEQASAVADHATARSAAHRLRGSSMTLGVERLRDVSAEIERTAAADRPIDGALIATLRREIAAANDAMVSAAPDAPAPADPAPADPAPADPAAGERSAG